MAESSFVTWIDFEIARKNFKTNAELSEAVCFLNQAYQSLKAELSFIVRLLEINEVIRTGFLFQMSCLGVINGERKYFGHKYFASKDEQYTQALYTPEESCRKSKIKRIGWV